MSTKPFIEYLNELHAMTQDPIGAALGTDRAAAEMESRAQAQDTEEEDLCASCGHPVEFHETPWGTSHTCDVEGASDRQCGCTQFVPKTPFDEKLEGDQE